MSQKRWLYWVFQSSGWGFLLFLTFLSVFQKEGTVDLKTIVESLVFISFGLLITHLFRYFIIKKNWLQTNVIKSVPRIIAGALLLGTISFGFVVLMTYVEEAFQINAPDDTVAAIFGGKEGNFTVGFVALQVTLIIINRSLLFFIWLVIYFGYHYFERTRKQEMERLKWQAAINETELNNLKSQLNPHFMFNAMNSIRALVDEDPKLAKNAITQLAGLLRSTLQTGKRKVVTVEEEMKIVTDYLQLEKIRYEERLRIETNIEPGIEKCLIPPLLLQTLVENAIKHGVSMLGGGGILEINIQPTDEELHIIILNDGTYEPFKNKLEGIGLKNSKKRLEILYGDKAHLTIQNVNNRVQTLVVIPKEFQKEITAA